MVAAKLQLLIALGVALNVAHAGPIDYSNSKATCTTRQCRLSAAGLLADMDPRADPCQDFSQFVCGGYNQKYANPEDGSTISRRDMIQKSNDLFVRSVVDASLGKSPKPARGDVSAQRNIKKLQDLFKSCMDEAAMLKAGRKPLADEVQKIAESLPASSFPADKINLSKTLGHINKLGFRILTFFSPYIAPDKQNPSIGAFFVGYEGLNLDMGRIPSYYQNHELLLQYRDVIATMFQVIMGEEDVANRTQPLNPKDIKKEWSNAAKELVDFELQLVEAYNYQPEIDDPSNYESPRTVEQMSALAPSVDWALMIQETLPADVNYTRPITVSYVPYLTKVDALLQNTPASTLQHYFSWLLIQNHVENLAEPYSQPWVAFKSIVAGPSKNVKVERSDTCIETVKYNLNHLVGHYFIRENFKGNSRKEVLSVINNIIFAYEKNFKETAWLDKATRDAAINKLNAIKYAIGYSTHDPDGSKSKSLDAFYRTYQIAANDYFGNQVHYSAWIATNNYAKINQPLNREEMFLQVTDVAAANAVNYNSFNLPAGILQDPFFNIENPEYMNYGSMGIVGSHEIGHAFDVSGRRFNDFGVYTNWWTNATAQTFDEKTQCFVEQYGNFTFKGPENKDYNLNGRRTIGENMSDNSGLKMAFLAWQSRFKSDPQSKRIKNHRLPGLDKYTLEQLFFISVARFWCGKMSPEALLEYSLTNAHSPPYLRTNGVAMNSPEFSKAFNCPAGSPMNPEKKCAVW